MIFAAGFAAVLALLEYVIYFQSNPHFFQGDSILYFYLRHRSLTDFLHSFVRIDPNGWYRPLTARTVQSLLYPWFGLEPEAYRAVHYLLFLAAVLAIYKLALVLTERQFAACIAALVFITHTVNSFITYDVLFTPEVVFTFFYVVAAASYVRYRQSGIRRFLGISILCFVAALCSKETALTLPIMLVMLDVVLNRAKIWAALSAARLHFAVLLLYVVMVIGYLGVQRPAFQSIMRRPGPEVVYRFSLDRTILHNADYAFTWAFNLPRGWQTESHLNTLAVGFLKIFRAAIILLAIWMMFRPERRLVIAGLLWFVIGIGPALPLFDHFLVYYLFMPLAGFSIMIGVIADALFRQIAAHHRMLAVAAIALPILVVGSICVAASRSEAKQNRFLGGSSERAKNSIDDLKKAHPALQPKTTIYISDADDPNLSWDTAKGGLFQIVYNDDTLQTLYWGWGEVITKAVIERGPVIVMKYGQLHLTDITQEFLAASEPPVVYRMPESHRLEITPEAATAGEKYRLSITGLPNSGITVHYTLNGSPVHAFEAHLDGNHQVSFDVSPTTEKGLYKFVGFRPEGHSDWEQAAASIRID